MRQLLGSIGFIWQTYCFALYHTSASLSVTCQHTALHLKCFLWQLTCLYAYNAYMETVLKKSILKNTAYEKKNHSSPIHNKLFFFIHTSIKYNTWTVSLQYSPEQGAHITLPSDPSDRGGYHRMTHVLASSLLLPEAYFKHAMSPGMQFHCTSPFTLPKLTCLLSDASHTWRAATAAPTTSARPRERYSPLLLPPHSCPNRYRCCLMQPSHTSVHSKNQVCDVYRHFLNSLAFI